MIEKAVQILDSDKYEKHLKCQDHLFSMVFCCLEKYNLLCEVATGMVGLSGKEETVRVNHLPKKSALADTNKCKKWNFSKKFISTCLRNTAFFCWTVVLRLL